MGYEKISFLDKQQGSNPQNIHEQEIWFSDINEIKNKFSLLIDKLNLRDTELDQEFSKFLKKKQEPGIANRFFIFDEQGNVSLNNSFIADDLTVSSTKTWSIDKINQSLNSAIEGLLGSAPEALNALNELADALGNDPNFSTTVLTALNYRLRFDVANQSLTSMQKTNALTNLGLQDYVSNRTIKIGTTWFTWAKKPSNLTTTLAVNEVISNGRISDTIHIYSAVYKGTGDITNFGTVAQNFTDGNYKDVEYLEFT